MEFPTVINWNNPFLFWGLLGGILFILFKENILQSNSGDPDQTPHTGSPLFAYVPQKGRKAYRG